MFSRLRLILGALIVCATTVLTGAASAQTARTVVLAAEGSASHRADVVSSLVATGRFAVVDVYDVAGTTPAQNPSLATLQTYDSVLVFNNSAYNDAAALGDLLHAYVAGGGVVVEMVFSTTNNAPLSGDWGANNDSAIDLDNYTFWSADTLGAVAQPLHPIMAGVSSLTASSRGTGALRPGSDLIASYASGDVLVATKAVGAGQVVALNFFPVRSFEYFIGWDATTDGALLMANALTLDVAAAPEPVPTMTEWAMILFGLLLAGGAALMIQRRRLSA